MALRAALLLRGLSQDHPFVDGNKRTALASASLFLARNGLGLEPEDQEATEFMVSVARGYRSLQEIARWIRENSRSR